MNSSTRDSGIRRYLADRGYGHEIEIVDGCIKGWSEMIVDGDRAGMAVDADGQVRYLDSDGTPDYNADAWLDAAGREITETKWLELHQND